MERWRWTIQWQHKPQMTSQLQDRSCGASVRGGPQAAYQPIARSGAHLHRTSVASWRFLVRSDVKEVKGARQMFIHLHMAVSSPCGTKLDP